MVCGGEIDIAAAQDDWSRSLPRPLVMPGVMRLGTLSDVRALVEKHNAN